jgi:hypothetical protein
MKTATTLLFLLLCGCGSDVHVLDGTDAGRADAGADPLHDSGVHLVDSGWELFPDGGGPLPDAGPLTDGSTPALFYRLVPAEVDFWVSPEKCESYEGIGKRFDITMHWFSSCQEPGPIEIDVDEDTRQVAITGWLWELVGPTDCRSVGAAANRSVFVTELTEGLWHASWSSGTVDITVGGAVPPVCDARLPLGSECAADCECADGRCADAVGVVGCLGRVCQKTCNQFEPWTAFHPECPAGQVCSSRGPVGGICANTTVDLCHRDADCPVGTRCNTDGDAAYHCEWNVEVDETSHRPCSSNSHCDPGFDCVELEDPSEDPRLPRGTCGIRCRTSDQRCPVGPPGCSVDGRPRNPRWLCPDGAD